MPYYIKWSGAECNSGTSNLLKTVNVSSSSSESKRTGEEHCWDLCMLVGKCRAVMYSTKTDEGRCTLLTNCDTARFTDSAYETGIVTLAGITKETKDIAEESLKNPINAFNCA